MENQVTPEKNTPILIVDDEASIRLTFEMFLTRAGYGPIITASTLNEALIAIKENEFDLIISDIVLEAERGTDLLCKLRESGVKCPVVMVTGFPNLDTAAEAVRYGAFDYISKPVNKETLLKFVRQALKHWELENERKQLLSENEKFKRYLEAIFRSVRDAIITIDNEMNIVQLNDTAKRWLQYSETDNLISLASYQSEMGKACLQDAQQVLSSRQEVREHQVECRKRDGNIRIISLNAAPLEDGFDEFNGVVIVARDITLPEPVSGSNTRNKFHGYVGCSQVMQNVYNLIENVGKVDTAVLVTGESGTGKELAAEALHAESQRRDMPLVKVDCAAMPEELLESELFGHRKGSFTGADRDRPGRLLQADNGTLFLDEIGDISPRMQLRLLRFLQEKTFTPVGQDTPIAVNVRIIAATNVNFTDKVKDGSFREDLYYRLKVVEIKLPPLRERKGGVPILVHHFLSMFREKLKRNIHGISDQAMEALVRYSWPGNVRELSHIIERACVLCDGPTISLEHFPEEIQKPVSSIPGQIESPDHLMSIANLPPYVSEEDEIIEALKHARGNKSKAARILNIDRSTLYRKMQRIGIASDIAKVNNK
ncbi:MAG: sigma-54-dependent Fis family transcriptional regulator [Proteobacteria bacterium]|nr:sigma-54-dependent Fis family transcriptional regulator [Pseudomonadota bacterium]MBU1059974.1 sigma-54-dependent Fis family transcriptional regulator [Pseudomonadota bacterium]